MTAPGDEQRLRDLEDEIASHLQHAAMDLQARGLQPDAAAREARRTFGNIRIVTAATHAQWRASLFGALQRLWRTATRGLRQAPAAAVGAVLALATGLAAVGTLAVVCDRLWWRPVAGVAAVDQVVRVYPAGFWTASTRAYVEFVDLQAGSTTLAAVAAYRVQSQPVIVEDTIVRARVAEVTDAYFGLLGVRAAAGQVMQPGDADGCVVSASLASRVSGTSESLLGATLRVGPVRREVRGIAPATFVGTDLLPIDVWCALPDQPRDRRSFDGVHVIGRLRPGVSIVDADRDARRVSREGWRRDGAPLTEDVLQLGPLAVTRGVTRPLDVEVARWLLWLAVTLLLAAVGTVTTLLSTRTLASGQARAVRAALGARRWQLTEEPVVLGLTLGAAGAATALVLTTLLVLALVPRLFIGERSWSLPPEIAAAVVALGMASGAGAGLVAAARTYPNRLSTWMSDLRTSRASAPRVLRGVLAVQTCISMVLLVTALLLIDGFRGIAQQPLGLQLDDLYVLTVDPLGAVPEGEEARWLTVLRAEAAARPEVAAAALAHTVPFASSWRTRVHVEGRDPDVAGTQGGGRFNPISRFVSPSYLDAVGTRMLRGRGLRDEDVAGGPSVLVVDEVLARRLWPGQDPLGQCLRLQAPLNPCTTVVGVAEAARHETYFGERPGQYYVPLSQPVRGEVPHALMLRVPRQRDAEAVRASLQGRLGVQGIVRLGPASAGVDDVRRPWRSGALTMTVVAVMAWIVTAAGAFAVAGESERRRMRDLAIRRALGSSRARTALAFLRPTAVTVLAGVLVGAAASLAAVGPLRGVLPQLAVPGPSLLARAALAVMGGVALACVPALRRVLSREISPVLQEP